MSGTDVATPTRDFRGPPGTVLSVGPAAASTMLFALCEIYQVTSSARALQLWAAIGLSVLAAVHTHAVLGRSLEGWRLVMPFQGGTCFIRLQALGWLLFGAALLLGLHLMFVQSWPGVPSLLGFMQFAAQALLVLSLSQFDSSDCSDRICACMSRRQWRERSEEGTPLSHVFLGLLFGCLLLSGAIGLSGSPSIATGWAIVAVMLVLQALGIHIMWTVTWNIMAVAAYLTGSESFLAMCACVGFANICLPWYLGRVIFWKAHFARRALDGQGHWFTTVAMPYLYGFSPAEVAYYLMYWGFIGFDQCLHILPALILFQHCADTVTPACAVASFLITVAFVVTVSLKHRVIDWVQFRNGFLKYIPFGKSSYFEPKSIAQLYLFESPLYPDTVFMDCIPAWTALFFLGNVIMLIIALLPNSASIIFHMGGGVLFSKTDLAITMCCLLVVSASFVIVAIGKTFKAKWSGARCKVA